MELFNLKIPTQIFFGRGVLEAAAKEATRIGRGNFMLVTTGRSLIANGHLERVIKAFSHNRMIEKPVVFDEVHANPRMSDIRKGIDLGRSKRVTAIIGLGGGSAIDAAKVIAAGLGMERSAMELIAGRIIPDHKTLPIIAIPTTAGSGSELSKAAIITDDIRGIKEGVRGENLYPQIAIVDPSFTDTVPLRVTAETGFDVLAHAMESYVSKAANHFTRMLSVNAVQTVGKYLPALVKNIDNPDARDHMSYAGMMMGINLGNASTGLPHRMQYPVGARTDTSHGYGIAALYPAWIKYEYRYCPEALEQLCSGLTGAGIKGYQDVANVINGFINELKLRNNLREIGIGDEVIPDLVNGVTGNLANDPVMAEDNVIYKIYKESI